MQSRIRKIALAAVLGAGVSLAPVIAGAQTAPGEPRQPAGPPNAGDTRATPGVDPARTPPGRATDPVPGATAPGVSDRSMHPAGPPNAGDTRAIPGRDPRPGWREPMARSGVHSMPPYDYRYERDRVGRSTSTGEVHLGTQEWRVDGPDHGTYVDPVNP